MWVCNTCKMQNNNNSPVCMRCGTPRSNPKQTGFRRYAVLAFFCVLLCSVIAWGFYHMGAKAQSVVQILAGNDFSIGLRRNGKVVFAGDLPAESKRKLQTWSDIQKLELHGWAYLVGYHADGSFEIAPAVDFGDTWLDWSKAEQIERGV